MKNDDASGIQLRYELHDELDTHSSQIIGVEFVMGEADKQ